MAEFTRAKTELSRGSFDGLHLWLHELSRAAQRENIPAGCSKSSSSEAAGESNPEAYPQGYVEDFDELRTKLEDFFSIRLNLHRLVHILERRFSHFAGPVAALCYDVI